MLLKSSLIVSCLFISCIAISLTRNKREAYELPDGIEEIIGNIQTTFTCTSSFGYFADVDNNCNLFHLCMPQELEGKQEMVQYTFACGNQTVFNQFSLTCAHESESIPCSSSPDFFYLNDKIGKVNELLHEEADLKKRSNYDSKKN